MRYQLSPGAIADLEEILTFLEVNLPHRLLEVEEDLTAAFERLGGFPGLGHRRRELTSKDVFFYRVDVYLIVYQRAIEPLPILRIFHTSRNVRKLLRR